VRYVIAVLLALVAALLLGVAAAALEAIRILPPEGKATFLVYGISCAMNNVVFFTLLFVPAAVLIAYVRQWRRRRAQARGRPVA